MEIKENEIVIFKNNKKQEGTKQPDYTGKLEVNGKIRDVSLWIREGKNGKFFSGVHKDEWKPEQKKQTSEIDSDPF